MADLTLSRSQLLLLSGTANRPLAEEMAHHLGQRLCAVTIRRFADGEIFVKIDENVRGRDVFIIQPTNPPAENLLELLMLIDAARRASAKRITAVIPYFGYARQDRKDQPRVAITSKLIANLIAEAGADRVISMDLHAPQLQGFFDIPADHRIENSPIESLFVTDTIPLKTKSSKIRVKSVTKVFAEAIKRTHEDKSISSLFDTEK